MLTGSKVVPSRVIEPRSWPGEEGTADPQKENCKRKGLTKARGGKKNKSYVEIGHMVHRPDRLVPRGHTQREEGS